MPHMSATQPNPDANPTIRPRRGKAFLTEEGFAGTRRELDHTITETLPAIETMIVNETYQAHGYKSLYDVTSHRDFLKQRIDVLTELLDNAELIPPRKTEEYLAAVQVLLGSLPVEIHCAGGGWMPGRIVDLFRHRLGDQKITLMNVEIDDKEHEKKIRTVELDPEWLHWRPRGVALHPDIKVDFEDATALHLLNALRHLDEAVVSCKTRSKEEAALTSLFEVFQQLVGVQWSAQNS